MIDELKAWSGLISAVLAIGAVIYTWLTAGGKQAQAGVEALRAKLDQDKAQADASRQAQTDKLNSRFELVEARLVKIESDLTHLPNREQWHNLQIAIERLTGRMETLDQRMTGRMDTLDERLRPVAATSARIQNYLMEQAGEK